MAAEGEVVAVDRWQTDYWVVEPGGTSRIGMQVKNYVAAVEYEISFESLNEGVIDLSLASGVSKSFQVSR